MPVIKFKSKSLVRAKTVAPIDDLLLMQLLIRVVNEFWMHSHQSLQKKRRKNKTNKHKHWLVGCLFSANSSREPWSILLFSHVIRALHHHHRLVMRFYAAARHSLSTYDLHLLRSFYTMQRTFELLWLKSSPAILCAKTFTKWKKEEKKEIPKPLRRP